MEPGLDATFGFALQQALRLMECRTGCIVVVDEHAPSPQRVVSALAYGLREPHDSSRLRESFIYDEQQVIQLLESSNDVLVSGDSSTLSQSGILGLGFNVVIRLARSGHFQVFLFLGYPKNRRSHRRRDLLRPVSDHCLNAIDRLVRRESTGSLSLDNEFLGGSQGFLDLERRVQLAANRSNDPVLIVGERGSGKELVARAVHQYSTRHDKPFVPVNSASLQPEIYASELLGYRKGAFTGAFEDHLGKFRAAAGGTLLLDEITEMPSHTRAGLLRALDHGEIQSLGYDYPARVDVRIIAATNRDISQLVLNREFPADLYDRLNVLRIDVPPLRQRKEDIPLLAAYFFRRFCATQQIGHRSYTCQLCLESGNMGCLDPDVMPLLIHYGWPGNVRELKNTVMRLISVCVEGEPIGIGHLPCEIADKAWDAVDSEECELRLTTVIRNHMIRVLQMTHGNKSAAARVLGLPLSTMISKMKRLELHS